MDTCELCQQEAGEMEFNIPTPLGLLRAMLCLDCWAAHPDDTAVSRVGQVVEWSGSLAVDYRTTRLTDHKTTVFSHVEDIPAEIQADVMLFMLNSRRPEKSPT